jgi:dTDP-4-dehydrorhamnose reductase
VKILVTGARGQVHHALMRTAAEFMDVLPLTHVQLDISQNSAVDLAVQSYKPHVIINLAAFSDIDKAQSESEQAYRINRDAIANLARAAQKHNARLIHLSSSDVFDGASAAPYSVSHPTNPVNVFGASKRAGELEIDALLDPQRWLIIRTSWLYSGISDTAMARLIADMGQHSQINAVVDQYARPTSSRELAQTLWDLVDEGARGIVHYAGEGMASWYDFTIAVRDEALRLGLLRRPVMIRPITTREQHGKAPRPANGVLDTESTRSILGRPATYWRYSLSHALTDIKVNHAG